MAKNRFDGKVAVITGGCSGIGLSTAVRIASEGGSVALFDINTEAFAFAESEIKKVSDRLIIAEANVTSQQSLKKAFGKTADAFGRLDVLVTCAGVGEGTRIANMTEEEWNRVISINLNGTFLSSKLAVEEMRKHNNGGAIVTVASIGGLRAIYSGTAFAASKGAVVNFTRNLAVELAPENIRVNCVCPGVVFTTLTTSWLKDPAKFKTVSFSHPMGRLGQPEEIAAGITFLASNDASYVTGVALPVDGGITAGKREDMDRMM